MGSSTTAQPRGALKRNSRVPFCAVTQVGIELSSGSLQGRALSGCKAFASRPLAIHARYSVRLTLRSGKSP